MQRLGVDELSQVWGPIYSREKDTSENIRNNSTPQSLSLYQK